MTALVIIFFNMDTGAFEYGNAVLDKLEYKEETDDVRAGHYTKLGYLVLGYRCE